MLKRIWQGFSGGPDFETCEHLTFLLDNQQLKLTVPKTPFYTEEPARQINFPFKQPGWFETHSEQREQHHLIILDTQCWPYATSLQHFIPEANELGMLSLSTQLKRVSLQKERKIDALNLTELSEYVIDEYEEHFNSPNVGEHGEGINTRIRNETIAWAKGRESPWTEKEIEDLLKIEMKSGKQPLSPAKIMRFGMNEWVHYSEGKHDEKYHSYRYFCLPLDSEFFLNFRFTYKIDRHDKFKKWKANARAAEKRILEMVELGPIPAIERPALAATATEAG